MMELMPKLVSNKHLAINHAQTTRYFNAKTIAINE